MTTHAVTEKYFELSNASKLDEVFLLFASDATYSSDNTGLFFGLEDIKEMMTNFFASFPKLHWEVHSIELKSEHIAEVEFTLRAHNKVGETIERRGIERLVVVAEKIRHIEVRNL